MTRSGFGWAFVVCIFIAFTLQGFPSDSVDWGKPFLVNGIALADRINSVINRLGSPTRTRLAVGTVASPIAEIWTYPSCEIKFVGGEVVGIAGQELSQEGVNLLRFRGELSKLQPKSLHQLKTSVGLYLTFDCLFHPQFGIGIPCELPALVAVKVDKDGRVAGISLLRSNYCQPDLSSPPSDLQARPFLPRLQDKLSATVPVTLYTSKGKIEMDIYPDSNPPAASRFLELVRSGFYDQTPFFNVFPGLDVEFGINWRAEFAEWRGKDLPLAESSRYRLEPGTIVLRSGSCTQVAINLQDLTQEQPFWNDVIGRVTSGLEVLQALQPSGCPGFGVAQGRLWVEGESYLRSLPSVPDIIIKAELSSAQ